MKLGDLVKSIISTKKGEKTLGIITEINGTLIKVRWLEPPPEILRTWDKYNFDEEMRGDPFSYYADEVEPLYV